MRSNPPGKPRHQELGPGAAVLAAWGTRSRSLTAAGLATVSNFYLLLHLDVAALDVAAPGVGGVGAPEEFDGKAVAGDLPA